MNSAVINKLELLRSSLEKCGEHEAAFHIKISFLDWLNNLFNKKESEPDVFEQIRSGSMVIGRGDSDSRGKPVSEVQKLLTQKGYPLPKFGVDGKFGPETDAAVRSFQEDNGLLVDGIIGRNTVAKLSPSPIASQTYSPRQPEPVMELNYRGEDIAPLAASIGISPLFLQAVMEIESNGNPSAIRFEPHIFNQLMEEKGTPERVPFTKKDSVFSKVKSETDENAFWGAYGIDKEAAILSTSWGTGQVMGKHLLSMYPNPDIAVKEFFSKPSQMSTALIGLWFRANPSAIKAANDLNFAEFSRIYNGPLYTQNQYDKYLANAYSRISSQRPEMVA